MEAGDRRSGLRGDAERNSMRERSRAQCCGDRAPNMLHDQHRAIREARDTQHVMDVRMPALEEHANLITRPTAVSLPFPKNVRRVVLSDIDADCFPEIEGSLERT